MTGLSKQLGVGIIEVMIALLLLSIAVLGYSALQGQAIKSTNESLERSQSLVIMENIAEKIRANPIAIDEYARVLNKSFDEITAPSKTCGLDGTAVTSLCDPEALAKAEAYQIQTRLQGYDFQINLYPCPNTGGTGEDAASNIMFSYCLISAWGYTQPTIGTDADPDDDGQMDCLTSRETDDDSVVTEVGGSYHPKATCMMMEI